MKRFIYADKAAETSNNGWLAEDIVVEMDGEQSTWNKYIKDYIGYKIEVTPVYNQKLDQIDWTVYLYENGKSARKLEVFETSYDAQDYADYEVYDRYIKDDEDDEDDDVEESVRARGRRNIKTSRKSRISAAKKTNRSFEEDEDEYEGYYEWDASSFMGEPFEDTEDEKIEESIKARSRKAVKAAVGGTVTLKDMNTEVAPVADFGCYGGPLSTILEDVFDSYYVNTSNISPDDEYYDEIVKLISEKYNGTEEFQQQVLDLAPATIQQAFDEYDIPATVVSGSCKWWHPREYNFSDDVIEFDMSIDTNWVESKFRELSGDSKFNKFLDKRYSSRDGFISFMPNKASDYEEILDPNSSDYWRLVSAIISYIVDSDPSISESVTEDLYEYIISNPDFITYSDLELY